MNRTTLTSLMASGLIVSVVALSAASGAMAQSAGTGGNGNGGAKGGAVGGPGGEGGGGRIIVCTGCADPNAFIEDGVLKGDGHGGGMTAAPVVAHVPRAPRRPHRPRKPTAYQPDEACHLRQDLLPDGRMVVYRDCGEVIRGYR